MLSVVIPALNEAAAIRETVETIHATLEKASIEHEIIVINDGSTDDTAKIARDCGARVVDHPRPGGYGRAIKDGMIVAKYDLIAITDADGTYPNDRLPELYQWVVENGFDMAVGARTGPEYRGTFLKMPARRVFLWLSEYATGAKIDDINSGLRVFRKSIVTKFLATISNGFSFTTTITLAHFLNGYFVKYIPIDYFKRKGASHIRYWRDTLRSMQIIVENILYYNPLKLFLLITNALFVLAVLAGVALFVPVVPESTHVLLSVTTALSFVSAIVVGAIGLAADLVRQSIRVASEAAALRPERPDVHR
jgi:glycosyltransferase involved in cell wall biosynthesis